MYLLRKPKASLWVYFVKGVNDLLCLPVLPVEKSCKDSSMFCDKSSSEYQLYQSSSKIRYPRERAFCYVFKLKVKRNRHLMSSEIFYCPEKLSSMHLLSSSNIRGELILHQWYLTITLSYTSVISSLLIFIGNFTYFIFYRKFYLFLLYFYFSLPHPSTMAVHCFADNELYPRAPPLPVCS